MSGGVVVGGCQTRVVEPMSRGAVVWRVFARSWLLSIAGGCVVGLVAGCGVAVFDDDLDSKRAAVVAGLAFLGGLAGIVLGFVLGVVVAMVAAAWLVPYPGPAKTLSTTRRASMVSVGALIGWVLLTTADWGWAAVLLTFLAVGLAWFMAPHVVRWYIVAMEPVDLPVPDDPA